MGALPGGRLEAGESPEGCVVREVREELGLAVEAGLLLDAWVYEPLHERRVPVLGYGCLVGDTNGTSRSAEHTALRTLGEDELEEIDLPAGYVRAVRVWAGWSPSGRSRVLTAHRGFGILAASRGGQVFWGVAKRQGTGFWSRDRRFESCRPSPGRDGWLD